MAAWVSREIFPLAPGPILLGGYSMGGTIALKTALDHPGRVAGLALFCTSSDWGEGRPYGGPLLRLPGAARLLALGGRMAARTGARRLFRQGRVGKEEFALLQTMLDGGNAKTEARCLRALVAADLRARLGEARFPALVVGGGRDRVSPPAHLERLARGIPGASFHLEPGADHLYALSHPDDLAGRLEAFADLVAKGLG